MKPNRSWRWLSLPNYHILILSQAKRELWFQKLSHTWVRTQVYSEIETYIIFFILKVNNNNFSPILKKMEWNVIESFKRKIYSLQPYLVLRSIHKSILWFLCLPAISTRQHKSSNHQTMLLNTFSYACFRMSRSWSYGLLFNISIVCAVQCPCYKFTQVNLTC